VELPSGFEFSASHGIHITQGAKSLGQKNSDTTRSTTRSPLPPYVYVRWIVMLGIRNVGFSTALSFGPVEGYSHPPVRRLDAANQERETELPSSELRRIRTRTAQQVE
jgi:hypothetical protein